jgi:ubiquinone/menaquinone biosynthesis C-methylase UbiE
VRRSRFDRWAPRYDASVLQRLVFDRVHELVLAEIAPRRPQTVLDVGCGTGRLLERISKRLPGVELAGVDASTDMIEVAQRKDLGARFEVAKAERLPFEVGVFDAAVTTISMHHWTDPPAGLSEVGRVLKPGGTLVIADFFKGGVYRRLRGLLPFTSGDVAFTAEELGLVLGRAGFRLVTQRVPAGWGGSLLLTVAERVRAGSGRPPSRAGRRR